MLDCRKAGFRYVIRGRSHGGLIGIDPHKPCSHLEAAGTNTLGLKKSAT
jgi:hypothetical protein